MAILFVTGQRTLDDSNPFNGTTQCALSFPVAAIVGNTIVVRIEMASNLGVSSVVDGGGNTYALAGTHLNGSAEVWIYVAPVTTAATTVTVTLTATTTSAGHVMIEEFSGLDNADLVEDTATASHTTSPYDSGTVDTTVADTLLVGSMSGSPGTYTQDVDFTDSHNWVGGRPGYKILTATGTHSWTVTSSEAETVAQLLVALNGAAAGGGGSTQNLFYRRRR